MTDTAILMQTDCILSYYSENQMQYSYFPSQEIELPITIAPQFIGEFLIFSHRRIVNFINFGS